MPSARAARCSSGSGCQRCCTAPMRNGGPCRLLHPRERRRRLADGGDQLQVAHAQSRTRIDRRMPRRPSNLGSLWPPTGNLRAHDPLRPHRPVDPRVLVPRVPARARASPRATAGDQRGRSDLALGRDHVTRAPSARRPPSAAALGPSQARRQPGAGAARKREGQSNAAGAAGSAARATSRRTCSAVLRVSDSSGSAAGANQPASRASGPGAGSEAGSSGSHARYAL